MRRAGRTPLRCALVLLAVGCGGPYAQKGRYAHEAADQAALGAEAYADLASIRSATEYDTITDFAVECVSQTVTAERLAAELAALPGDAYGARDQQKKRTQDAATRCLAACPRVQHASTAPERERSLGEKYAPRCEASFGRGALQLADGERAMDRAQKLLAEHNLLEAREAIMEVETCLRGLAGESSARQSALAQKLQTLRAAHGGELVKADSFARDPWVVATRGRIRAIASERARLQKEGGHDAHLSELAAEEADLSKQLFERRQNAGI